MLNLNAFTLRENFLQIRSSVFLNFSNSGLMILLIMFTDLDDVVDAETTEK